MPRTTIRDVMAGLASAFPGTVFERGRAGWRGINDKAIQWIGGPSVEAVKDVADSIMWRRVTDFYRTPTDAEMAIQDAEDAAVAEAWKRDRPRRKQIGQLKRQSTLALKRAWGVTFEAAYPDVPFSVRVEHGALTLSWIDGPAREAVEALLGGRLGWSQLKRLDSPIALDRKRLEARFARQLRKRRELDVKIAAGIARRAALRERFVQRADPRQMCLMLTDP